MFFMIRVLIGLYIQGVSGKYRHNHHRYIDGWSPYVVKNYVNFALRYIQVVSANIAIIIIDT